MTALRSWALWSDADSFPNSAVVVIEILPEVSCPRISRVLSRALRNGSIAPDGRSALCQTPAMTTGGGRRTAMHANRSRSVLAGCAAVAIAGLAAGGAWADDALGSAYDAKSAG